MFKYFTTEMKCAMVAGSVFVFFFASSMVSIARGEVTTQQTINMSEEDQPYGYDLSGNPITTVNPPTPPGAGGPNNNDGPLAGEQESSPIWNPSGWLPWVSDFFSSIMASLSFR